ncbi:hypothetical protein MPDQ_003480 [Monascus purpureus]|uniref:Uncharacterized protein n=1 Tax=Monascus purpureus TaxID=5098 RepID=A0A507R2E3_MONPU|nr:hypothetical protein MPDQ_003480 [Monascus purpureus]BDD57133.1 hypothetical protein MAP00_002525 [Monascus purpureus]
MCPMLLSRLSDGPALVLSHPQEHAFVQFPSYQPRLDTASGGVHGNHSSFANGFSSSLASSSWRQASPSFPIGANPSKKRSRAEAGFDVTDAPAFPVPPPMSHTNGQAVHGDEMVVEDAPTGFAASVSRQVKNTNASSPWTGLPCQKSQRLNTPVLDDNSPSSTRPRLQPDSTDNEHLASGNRSGPLSPQEPLVDDATRLLGISWQRVESGGDRAAAMRGWKKYIDNQFSSYLWDSQILMKNRALDTYLVAAHPMVAGTSASSLSFYLFSEDLSQARLVGSTWGDSLKNLTSVPIVFEGTEVLRAAGKSSDHESKNASVLYSNPMDNTLPLLRTHSVQPVSCGGDAGLNGGIAMGMGMEIDS